MSCGWPWNSTTRLPPSGDSSMKSPKAAMISVIDSAVAPRSMRLQARWTIPSTKALRLSAGPA